MLADDRFCGTDADQHEDISRNGSSGFGGSADSATADLSPCPINAQIAEQRARHAVRFPLRHILCNRLTCSLVCSCRNPSAVTFLYMCQTISFSKSSRIAREVERLSRQARAAGLLVTAYILGLAVEEARKEAGTEDGKVQQASSWRHGA